MNTNDLLKDIKKGILDLVKAKYDQQSKELEKDVDVFLTASKEKLIRWALLLEQRQISRDEFGLLLQTQKDVFVIKALYRAGISKISLGHLKNNIIDIIIKKVLH